MNKYVLYIHIGTKLYTIMFWWIYIWFKWILVSVYKEYTVHEYLSGVNKYWYKTKYNTISMNMYLIYINVCKKTTKYNTMSMKICLVYLNIGTKLKIIQCPWRYF